MTPDEVGELLQGLTPEEEIVELALAWFKNRKKKAAYQDLYARLLQKLEALHTARKTRRRRKPGPPLPCNVILMSRFRKLSVKNVNVAELRVEDVAQAAVLLDKENPVGVDILDKQLRRRVGSSDWVLLVAHDCGMVVGLLVGYVAGSISSQDPYLYIEWVVVGPTYRLLGVGRNLMKLAERAGLERGCNRVTLDALPSSVEFHLSCGFRVTSPQTTMIKTIES